VAVASGGNFAPDLRSADEEVYVEWEVDGGLAGEAKSTRLNDSAAKSIRRRPMEQADIASRRHFAGFQPIRI